MVPIIFHYLNRALGIDVKYFATNTFWAGFKNGVGMVVGLVLSMAFARLVSKSVYGQYTFVLSSMYLINFLSVPRFDIALSQSVAAGHDQSFFQTTKVSVMGSLVMSVILALVGGRYIYLGDPSLGYSFFWAALLVPLLLGLNTFEPFLIGKRRFDRSAQFAALGSILTGMGLVVTMWRGGGVTHLVATYLLINGILTLWFWLQTKKLVANQRRDPDVVNFGLYLTFLALLTMVASKLGNVLLNHFRGAEVLATYAIAIIIPRALQNLLQNLVDVAKMKVAGGSRQAMELSVVKHGWKWVGLGIMLALGLWVSLPLVIPIIFTHKYDDAIVYAQVAGLSLIFFPICTFLGSLIAFEKKKKFMAVSSFLSSGLNVVVLPLAVYFGGIWGIIGANLLFWVYSIGFNTWAFWRKSDL